MNLINDKNQINQELDNVFQKLMTISQVANDRYCRLIPLKPDINKSTYILSREKKTMEKNDFEIFSSGSIQELDQSIRNMWQDQNMKDLIEITTDLVNLALSLKATEEQTEEVSPFMYVMF